MTDATWKYGYRNRVDAKIAYAELEKVRKAEGVITPEGVLASAKPAKSPIHKVFTWDNKKAADLHRRKEARTMIASIEIVRIELPQEPSRAYEIIAAPTVEKPNKKAYTTTEEILEDPAARDTLLMGAVKDALAYRKRYSMLSELAVIIHAIDEFAENADDMLRGANN